MRPSGPSWRSTSPRRTRTRRRSRSRCARRRPSPTAGDTREEAAALLEARRSRSHSTTTSRSEARTCYFASPTARSSAIGTTTRSRYLDEALALTRKLGDRPGEWSRARGADATPSSCSDAGTRRSTASDEFTQEQHRRRRALAEPARVGARDPRPARRARRGATRPLDCSRASRSPPTSRSSSGYLGARAALRRAEGRLREALADGRGGHRRRCSDVSASRTRPSSRGSSRRSRPRSRSASRAKVEELLALRRRRSTGQLGRRTSTRRRSASARGSPATRPDIEAAAAERLPRARHPLLARGHAARARRARPATQSLARRGARDLRAARGDARGSSGSMPPRPRAPRCPHDLPELRHREPRGTEVLLRVRRGARERAARRAARRTSRARSSAASAARARRRCARRLRPGSAAPAAERRLVSVLFADLVGFTTALGGPRRRGDARAPLPLLRHVPRGSIERYGGTVEKFIGDAVMAVWGTPIATEDDAERAVRAALDLVAAVPALGDESALRAARAPACSPARPRSRSAPRARAWSPATSSTPRRGSSRPPSPGPVLVGEATRRATEAAIAYEDAGDARAEGQGGAGRALARAPRDRRPAAARSSRPASSRRSSAATASCASSRSSSTRRADERQGAPRLGHRASPGSASRGSPGSSTSTSTGSPTTSGGTAAAASPTARASRTGRSPRWCACAPASPRTRTPRPRASKLARDARASTSPTPRSARSSSRGSPTCSGSTSGPRPSAGGPLRRLAPLLRAARRAGTRRVLVFEDMQWADAGLLDFVEYLLEWSRSHPIFVLALARPELPEQAADLGRRATQLHVALPRAALATRRWTSSSTGFVPGLPEDAARRRSSRAPRASRCTRSRPCACCSTAACSSQRGRRLPARPARSTTLEVPETLHALIAARLDGLAAGGARDCSRTPPCSARRSREQALAALSGARRGELEPLLAALVRKEVLGVQADPRSPERGQYGFLQDLVRHVAYETLSKRERKARHLAAATHLEDAFAQRGGDRRGHRRALPRRLRGGTATPTTRPEIKAKARAMLARAAERADVARRARGGAALPRAGGGAHRRAGGASGAAPASWRARRPGNADFDAAEGPAAAAGSSTRAGEPHAAARVSGRLGDLEWLTGPAEQGMRPRRRRSRLCRRTSPTPTSPTWRLAWTGTAYLAEVDRRRGRTSWRSESRRRCDFRRHSRAARHQAQISLGRGRPGGERRVARACASSSRSSTISRNRLRAYANLSDSSFHAIGTRRRSRYLGEALELARRRGDAGRAGRVLGETTYPLYMLGRWDEAVATFDELPEDQLFAGTTLERARLGAPRSCSHRGDLDEARRTSRALRRARETRPTCRIARPTSAARRRSPRAEGRLGDAVALGPEAVEISGTRSASEPGREAGPRPGRRVGAGPRRAGSRGGAARGGRGAPAGAARSVPRGADAALPRRG